MLAVPPVEPAGALLTFTVAGKAMTMPAAEVAEVGRVPPCTRIPNAPPSLCGVATIRGRVVPVVSLAALLGKPMRQSAADRLLVLAGGAPIGLVVEAVIALGLSHEAPRLDAQALLDREFSARHRATGPQAPVLPPAPVAEPRASEDRVALVALALGAQEYALPLDQVDRVMRPPEALTRLPHSDAAMLGTIALDDELLPVVSLAVLLGLPVPSVIPASTRILVAVIAGERVGLMVERVTGTIAVPRGMIDPVPSLLTRGAAEARVESICRLEGGRRLVSLLSTAHLFDNETTTLTRSSAAVRLPDRDVVVVDVRETFVIFRLGGDLYGLPIGAVDEVARHPEGLTRVPDAPEFIAGLMNLRGRTLPVIAMAQRFGAAREQARSRRVIVISAGGVTAGLAVDAVTDVLSFPVTDLQPAPDIEDGSAVFDRIAVQDADRMILLISPSRLVEAAAPPVSYPPIS